VFKFAFKKDIMLKLIQLYFKILSNIAPKTAAKQAFNFFQKVRFKTIREREQVFYDEANTLIFEFNNDTLEYYEFCILENELVISIHGWDSNAGCMYDMVKNLLKAEKYMLVFNLPLHGFHKAKSTIYMKVKMCLNTF
jgi:hypothetical protein